MSSPLLSDLLNFSTLHSNYIIENSRKSIFERYNLSDMIINIFIPALIILIVFFMLKKKYDDKKVKIFLAQRFKKDIKKNNKKFKSKS
jgi:hypothetical protein|uniref:Uncharacterized protein n=1 Tax=viral metagenome TaxID=1070528 RepID=A0A6C0J2B0_9ZZZZ